MRSCRPRLNTRMHLYRSGVYAIGEAFMRVSGGMLFRFLAVRATEGHQAETCSRW